MMFSQIKLTTLGALQGLIDSLGLPVAVGEISDNDYAVLSRGYGVLNWDVAITSFASLDTCVELVFKLLPTQSTVDAAVLGAYSIDDETLELHYIESFIRRVNGHPLHGKVMLLTIMFSYMLLKALDGKMVALVDPFEETIDYYRAFGFEHVVDPNGSRMIASVDGLKLALESMIQK